MCETYKMERKEVDTEEFIDHTLLATELMHNNFMMDLMDHTGVFPKTEGPTNLSTNGHSATTGSPPELNFHNTIFQFVNKHVEVEEVVSKQVPNKETDVEFLTINSSFLDRATANAGSETAGSRDVVPQQQEQVPQSTFHALAIEPNVPIDVSNALEDDDLLYAHSACTINARKVLPHKKRISRKLKGSMCSMDTADLEQHHQQNHNVVQVQQVQPTTQVANYSCEICGYAVQTQIEFYAHLKQHYDPVSIEQRLDVPQQQQQHQQQQQQQQQKEPLDMCGLSTQDKLEQEQAKLDQVFHDVQLNFENFHSINQVDDDVVDNVSVNMVIHADTISMHKNDGKLTPVGVTNTTASNDVPVVDDVEFSDTEDMLEGIRNVVDKVSIEDTCDELVDLELTASGMRAPWFNNNFSDIAFSGLLLPGEPPPTQPPTTATDADTVIKTNHMETDQQMTLSFLNKPNEQQSTHPKLEMGHKKNYIAAAAFHAIHSNGSDSNQEQTLLIPSPEQPASSPNSGTSVIEQLQRSPLIISESFKLEDVDSSAPIGSIAASPADTVIINDSTDGYLVDLDKYNSDEPITEVIKQKYHCDKCNRNFNSYNALKYHQHTHSKERAFQCSNCQAAFYTPSSLRQHERTHTGIRPYKCEQCDFKFRQWGDLKLHIISKHSEIKAHMCEYCGKSFSRKYSLVVHRRIHTSEKNYACQYCQKTFRASSYLLTHTKVHTGEKPYPCTVCDKKFRVNGDLRRHSRIHDPSNPRSKRWKQIQDEADAVCGESEQEILGC